MAKKYIVTVNGSKYEVVVEDAGNVAVNTVSPAPEKKEEKAPEAPKAAPAAAPAPAGGSNVNAPLPGTVLKVAAKQGQSVKKGDLLCVIEAMKMENEILAPNDATVVSVSANEGATVNSGDVLFVLG